MVACLGGSGVERQPRKLLAAGSIPARGSIFFYPPLKEKLCEGVFSGLLYWYYLVFMFLYDV